MIRAQLLIFLCLSVLQSKSQESVITHTYGGAAFEEFRAVQELPEGGYVMAGTTGSQEGSNTDIYLVRSDSLLNCEWSLSLGGEGVDVGRDVTVDANSNVYVCGFRSGISSEGYDAVVYKISSEGDIGWEISLGGNDWDFANAIDLDATGRVWMGGSAFQNGIQKPWLTSFNAEGEGNGQWILPCENSGEIFDVKCTESGIIVCGYAETESGISQSVIWFLDSEASVIWQRTEGDGILGREATAVDTNGEFIYVCGRRQTETFLQAYSQRLDYFGIEQLWSPELHPGDNEYTGIMAADGAFYSIGRTRGYGFGGYEGFIFRFSDSGGFENGVFYGTENEDAFIGGVLVPGGFIACGARQNEEDQWQALVMLYRRSVLYSEDISDPEDTECLPTFVEENPESNSLFGEYSLFDLTGKFIANGRREDDMKWSHIQLGLPTGMYVVKFKSGATIKLVNL
jgi:hypothetical protein